jgi:twitching motility protein PilT
LAAIDYLRTFRTASWTSEGEAVAFAEGVESPQANDVLRLLKALTSAGATGEPGHAMRVLAFRRLAERVPEKELFAHFVRALKGADPDLREALVQLLPKVNSILDHGALCALMRAPEADLRAAVAAVLAQIGAKTVFEALSEMVREPRFPGRSEAMHVLVAIAEHRAIPALQAVLAIGSAEEKIQALDHLIDPRCMGRDPELASRAVAAGLQDATESVAAHALSALAQVGGEADYFSLAGPLFDSASIAVVKAAIDGLRMFPSPRAIVVLQRKLRDGPAVVRSAAIEVLESIGTADVLKPLVEVLSHTQVVVRLRAAEALSRLSAAGKLDLARTVIWLLRSQDVNIRRMAVDVAQSVRDPDGELWPKLLSHLRDEDWWVRERVADALLEIAGDKLLRHIVAYLNDPIDVVRRFAVDVLMRLKAPESLGALVRTATSDSDWWVRERAIEAIAALQDQRAVPYLLDLMLKNADLQICCLQALSDLKAPEAAQQVATLLRSPEPDVRAAALRCLSALDDPLLGAAVQPLLKDPSDSLRGLARDLLARWRVSAATATTPATEAPPMLDQLLLAMAKMECDDLILAPDRRPFVMRLGTVAPLAKNVFSAEQVRGMLLQHLSPKHMRELEEHREVDFSHELKAEGLRFRVNVFEEMGGLGAVFRIVKGAIPRLESLGLPPAVATLGDLKNGLVLVGGPTGSGKSTTLAALIDRINSTTARHIITFEDPIEVVHAYQKSLVNQREIHTHTGALDQALRATLREDPDVILIGEMRDLPTIAFAVTAAETGHLVFGTIHTVSAALTVDRLINAFPPGQQDQVRSVLAGSLRAVICQYLLKRQDGPGRCLSVEVMLSNEAIANLIRKGKAFQIPSVITTSREAGMQLMDTELMRLLKEGKVSAEDAYAKAVSKKDFEPFLGSGTAG